MPTWTAALASWILSCRFLLILAPGPLLVGSLACATPRNEPLEIGAIADAGPEGGAVLAPGPGPTPGMGTGAVDAGLRPTDAPAGPAVGDPGAGARFTFELSIDGPGRVRSAAGDVDCVNPACTVSVTGRSVTLLAEPEKGARFGGWSGGCSGREPTCTFDLPGQPTGPVVITARFLGRGDALWSTQLDSPVHYVDGLQVAGDALVLSGNFKGTLAAQGITVSSRGDRDVFLARFTMTGALDWLRGFGGPAEDRTDDMATNGRDGILASFVSGGVGDFGNGPIGREGVSTSLLAAFDGQGRHVWTSSGTRPTTDETHYWSLAWLGDRYAAGGNSGITVLDELGRQVGEDAPWGGLHAWMMERTPDGGFVVAGWYFETAIVGGRRIVSGGGDDPLVVRYAPSKAVVWVADTLRGPGADSAQVDLIVDERGDVYVIGQVENGITIGSRSYPGVRGDWVAKLAAADGRPLWSRVFSGSLNALATSGGDLFLAGTNLDLDGTAAPELVARLSGATGAPIWINTDATRIYRLAASNGRLFSAGTDLAERIP
jgi:hypothetical protein